MCGVSSSRHAFPLVSCHAQEVTGAGGRADNPFYKVVLVGAVVIATNNKSELWRGRILCCQNLIGSQGGLGSKWSLERRGGGGILGRKGGAVTKILISTHI